MDEHLLFLFSFLDEVEKEIADDAEKQVWIEKCINIKTLSDFTVSCSYGDMVLIICVLKDYLKLIANKEGPTWDYYRDKFSKGKKKSEKSDSSDSGGKNEEINT